VTWQPAGTQPNVLFTVPWQPPAAPPPAAVLAACWPPAWVPGPAGVPADGPDPAVTSHCGEYDWPHVTLPTRLPPARPAAGQRGLLPGGQHQDRCQPGHQH
jgi:hypothetical protein